MAKKDNTLTILDSYNVMYQDKNTRIIVMKILTFNVPNKKQTSLAWNIEI